jgi:hypothetical protein
MPPENETPKTPKTKLTAAEVDLEITRLRLQVFDKLIDVVQGPLGQQLVGAQVKLMESHAACLVRKADSLEPPPAEYVTALVRAARDGNCNVQVGQIAISPLPDLRQPN